MGKAILVQTKINVRLKGLVMLALEKKAPPHPPPTTVYHHQGRSVSAPKVSGPQVSVFHSPQRGSQICFHYMGIFSSSETTHPRPNQPLSTLSGFLKEILIYVSIFISHKSLEDSQTIICQNSNIHPSCCFCCSQFSPPQTVQSIRLSLSSLYLWLFFVQ